MGISTSAKGSAAGYLYQAYYSLLKLLQAEPGSSVVLERIEDVDLYDGDGNLDLLQLKHQLKPKGALSKSSVDFLKTLSNWGEKLTAGKVGVDTTSLKLLTVQSIKPDCVPWFLVAQNRDIGKAHDLLKEFLKKEPGVTIEPFVTRLKTLEDDTLRELLSISEIVGNEPNIDETEDRIRNCIRIMVPPQYLDDVLASILGLWIRSVRKQLTDPDAKPVSQSSLHESARHYASYFRDESLPIYSEIKADENDIENLSDQRFVNQLEKLGINTARLRSYKEDYFRAFQHISKWTRNELISEEFIGGYFERLEREWREVLLTLVDDLEYESNAERTKFGKELLKKLMLENIPQIKRDVDEPFVGRGSYHMLADEEGRIFWHPDFEIGLLEHVLEQLGKGAA